MSMLLLPLAFSSEVSLRGVCTRVSVQRLSEVLELMLILPSLRPPGPRLKLCNGKSSKVDYAELYRYNGQNDAIVGFFHGG